MLIHHDSTDVPTSARLCLFLSRANPPSETERLEHENLLPMRHNNLQMLHPETLLFVQLENL